MKREETKTYLLIFVIVLVLAFIILATISVTFYNNDEETLREKQLSFLQEQQIGILHFSVTDYDTTLILKNNFGKQVLISSITLDGKECHFAQSKGYLLHVGKEKAINCQNMFELKGGQFSWDIEINWTDLALDASYVQKGTDLYLSGDVGTEYKVLVSSNLYWDEQTDGCWSEKLNPHPICTCNDLERIKTNEQTLSQDYILRNSIDFERCNTFFKTDFVSGKGWAPIGTKKFPFTGNFNGRGLSITGLRINDSQLNNAGLFGLTSSKSVNLSKIQNLYLSDISIQANNYVGGLVGEATKTNISNVCVIGSIYSTGKQVGEISGTANGHIEESISRVSISES